ncbi:MAG TPA: hypothetical protein VEQ63_13235, partial [Bryobacteraceae bacterium]|nr:hypothetical protein [Bryobacteraceae bacterium]
VNAGADASYAYVRALKDPEVTGQPAQSVLTSLFQGLRMPGDAVELLQPGDLIALEYGGYLKVGTTLTAGYQMQGSSKAQVGELNLSESYSLSVLGSLGVTASIAGRFRVQVSAASAPSDASGRWVRVVVNKSKQDSIGIAADVKVQFANKLDGLPGASDEFLGAVLGVTSKSWFNYLARASQVRTFEDLEEVTDTLSWHFLSQLTNKGFDQIKGDLDQAVSVVKKVTDAYQKLDSRAVNLLDRYYDQVESKLEPALKLVAGIENWRTLLAGQIPEDVRTVVAVLSDADPRFPLSWIANLAPAAEGGDEGIGELQKRAKALLDSLRAGLHLTVIDVIKQAQERFGLNTLFKELEKASSSEKLRQLANDRVGGFASRLIGQALTSLRRSDDFTKAAKRVRAVLDSKADFQKHLYDRFTEAVNNDYSLSLRAEYQRATDQAALIDALVCIDNPAGSQALMAVSDGEFDRLFADYDPAAVRINGGALSWTRRRKRAFNVNIFGWHDKFNYERTGIDELIVSADQHIKTESDGTLSVYTQFSLSQEKLRRTGLRRSEETIRTNLLLQAIGESRGVVEFDERTHAFLLDAVSISSARYAISFTDTDTDPKELLACLRFAEELNILSDVTPNQIARALPMQGNSYGQVQADYDVRFTPEGLKALFSREVSESQLRAIMRKTVLINYLASRDSALAGIAWVYWSPGFYTLWKGGQAAFTNHLSPVEFKPISAAPFLNAPAPAKIVLQPELIQNLSTLYFIEDGFVEAMESLRDALQPDESGVKMTPKEFARKLESFGRALSKFDDFDKGVNTIFALFDQVIRLSASAEATRAASLTLSARVGASEVSQIYASLPQARAAAVSGRLSV